MRTLAMLVAAVGILLEGLVIGVVLFALGGVIDAYSMSLNGTDPQLAQVTVKILGVVLAVLLVVLAAGLAAAAARDRHARRVAFVAMLIQCVVVAIAGIALGWAVFGGTLLVLGTLLYALLDDSQQPVTR
jgi:MFS family permease